MRGQRAAQVIGGQPAIVQQADWATAMHQTGVLAPLHDAWIAAGAANNWGTFWAARAALLDRSIRALGAAHDTLAARSEYQQCHTQDTDQLLVQMQQALDEARAQWAENAEVPTEADSARQARLLTAEAKLYAAQARYESLKNCLQRISQGEEVLGVAGIVAGAGLVTTPLAGVRLGIPGGTAVEMPASLEVGLRGTPAYREPGRRMAHDYYQDVTRRDLLIAGLVVLIAAATGLTSLWGANATFGGMDYLGAFMWGFGLQSATGFLQIANATGVLPQQPQ
jgi:hypothetical protein